MNYHLIARADQGGLAQQTAELARHVPPRRALIIDLGRRGRGRSDPGRYAHVPETRVTDGIPDDDDWRWITAGGHPIFTAETGYRTDWTRGDTPTILQANPELYGGDTPTVLTVPTHWEAHRLGDPLVLPVPVARDRLTPRPPDGPVTVWYHPAAPAMLDRNGTRLALAALQHVRSPITLIVRSADCRRERTRRIGAATLIELTPTEDYAEAYPTEAQGLLLPRRYGGLCLPAQEAASLGWPIVTLDLEPQRSWLPADGLVPARRKEMRRMRGGDFWIHDCSARRLARTLDQLSVDAEACARLVEGSLAWAGSLDWSRWVGEYRRVLSLAQEQAA